MKIGLISDCHLEAGSIQKIFELLPEKGSVDVFLVAGDATRAEWAFELCCLIHDALDCPVLFTPGNHEYYCTSLIGCTMTELDGRWEKEFAHHPDVHYLQNTSITIGEASFFGSTWWTNLRGYGSDMMDKAKLDSQMVDDFAFINFAKSKVSEPKVRGSGYAFRPSPFKKITPDHMIGLNQSAVKAYKAWYASAPGKKILMSHFPMLKKLQHPGFKPHPYFVSNDDLLIERFRPDLLVFGHTHYDHDINVFGIRCVSNQRGYESEMKKFDRNFVIEI